MWAFILLFITPTMTFFSLGSPIQTTLSLDVSNSVQATRRTIRPDQATSLVTKVTVYSRRSIDSVEGSGHHVEELVQKNVFQNEHWPASKENHSGSRITTTLELSMHHSRAPDQGSDKAKTGSTHSNVHIITEGASLKGSHIATGDQLEESHASIVKYAFLEGGDGPELSVQTSVLPFKTNQSQQIPGGPCGLGLSPCVTQKHFNGTDLLWDDLSRTLAFAWQLHVFGSASLFILMAVLAVLGTAGACTSPHSLRNALTLANSLLIMGGTLRGVVLLIDPYGTHHILSRATLAALHNVPLLLMLWAQVALALVTLRGLRLFVFPPKLQRPWVVGGLAISHCTSLFVADLYTSTLSPPLPLALQISSLCVGLPFCLGILIKCLSNQDLLLRSSLPQWFLPPRIDRRAKRVTAVCAFLGALCCSLQMYSLLWLYGLLGNWRRFSWGWWLSQFWARILELAWGFFLLVLASWIFWMPSGGQSRGYHWKGRSDVVKEKSLWCRLLANVRKGPLRPSKKTWEDLKPNNWAKYNLSGAGVSNNVMCPYGEQPSTILAEYRLEPVNSIISDAQAALLWQKVCERECILSLIEFDMKPPSPINIRRSIDNALYHGQLVAGGLFTLPPPSWTQTLVTDTNDGHNSRTMFPPSYVGYGWMLDTDSISASLDHFQAKEPMLSPSSIGDCSIGSNGQEFHSVHSALMHHYDWPDEDVTDL